jgi:hypothetical protein
MRTALYNGVGTFSGLKSAESDRWTRKLLRVGDSLVRRIGEDTESVGIIRTTAFKLGVISAGLSA